jgi:hypothetical protein
MFAHAKSALSRESMPSRHWPTPSAAMRRLPEDADATGAPWWAPLSERTPDAVPQADGSP